MFRDTSFASEVKRKEREERTLMFNLERQRQREARLQDKLAKEALCQYYSDNYGGKLIIKISLTHFVFQIVTVSAQ